MTPSRILPDLQASLLCEEVRQEVNGNFFLIGVINYLAVPKLPVTAFRLCMFNRWTAGIGSFLENVRLIAPDQVTVLRQTQLQFVLQNPAHHATNVTMFGQVKFETAGSYYVEVYVDDVMKLRFPLVVHVVPQPGAAPAQGQAAPPGPAPEDGPSEPAQ